MRTTYLTLITLFLGLNLFAQKEKDSLVEKPKNSIFLNFVGDVSTLSINYDRIYEFSPFIFISGKLGIGFNEAKRKKQSFLCLIDSCKQPLRKRYTTIPHHITVNFGKRRNYIELGYGGTFTNSSTQSYIPYFIIGYRLQPLKSNRFNFRLYTNLPDRKVDVGEILFSPVGFSIGLGL